MNIELTFDTRRLNEQLAALELAMIGMGGDASTIVANRARNLLARAIRFTPPKTFAQGRKAVKRDIYRAMTPAEINLDGTRRWQKDEINELVRENNIRGFQAFLNNLKNGSLKTWKVEPFDPARLHKAKRDRRGRIQNFKKVFVLETSRWKTYVRDMQKRVGFMRAGWVPAFQNLGGRAASWFARHTAPAGFVLNALAGPKPTITFGNRTRGVGQLARAFRAAISAQTKALEREVKLALVGYAKDMKSGNRVTRKAKREQEVIAE